MEIPDMLDVLECPVCHSHTCKSCLTDFTNKRIKGQRDQDLFSCTICLKEYKMRLPNKRMLLLLQNVIMFGCDTCARYWCYEEYRSHRMKGQCKKDDKAANNIASLTSLKPVFVP